MILVKFMFQKNVKEKIKLFLCFQLVNANTVVRVSRYTGILLSIAEVAVLEWILVSPTSILS